MRGGSAGGRCVDAVVVGDTGGTCWVPVVLPAPPPVAVPIWGGRCGLLLLVVASGLLRPLPCRTASRSFAGGARPE